MSVSNPKNTSDENKIFDPESSPSLKSWGEPADLPKENICIDCGWGRLIFGHTFKDNEDISRMLRNEEQGSRDLALYIRDPQVVIASAPQDLFIDPSYTFRLLLKDYKHSQKPGSFSIRPADPEKDVEDINRIYQSWNMVSVDRPFSSAGFPGEYQRRVLLQSINNACFPNESLYSNRVP